MHEDASAPFPLVGEIDMATAETVRQRLYAHVASSVGDVILDGERLRFIDSCGLGVLIRLAIAARSQGRRLHLINVDRFRRTFEIAGLSELLGIDEAAATAEPVAQIAVRAFLRQA